jgi:hypothetical protein
MRNRVSFFSACVRSQFQQITETNAKRALALRILARGSAILRFPLSLDSHISKPRNTLAFAYAAGRVL